MKKMYIVLNEDIKDIMNNPGYACSQVAHASFDALDARLNEALQYSLNESITLNKVHDLSYSNKEFRFDGNKIIILRTSQEEMKTLNNLGCLTVIDRDKGGIITAIYLGIYDEEKVPDFIKKMKLYRGE